MENLPDRIQSEPELEELLTRPGPELTESIRSLASPLVILGAGGKMGPTLAVMARRAAEAAGHPLEIIAISRFRDGLARRWLEKHGVGTLSCDLLERDQTGRLPASSNVVYLVGLKFGTSRDPAATWAINTLAPAYAAEHYRAARIVALSTGNVYPLVPVKSGGAAENHPLHPVGEYPNAAIARERIFKFASAKHGTQVALLRLLYAVEPRYGVLVDIATRVHAGEEIDLTTGYFNCIWQRDANEMILRAFSLAHSPPSVWNLCRPEIFSVRETATRIAEILGVSPRFTGQESSTALLATPAALLAKLGSPPTPPGQVLRWVAGWVKAGGRNLGRPTHFEVRDGQY